MTNDSASDATVTATKPKAKRGRSPNYPGLDFSEALARARQLYAAQRQHPASTASILETWGFKSRSGAGGVVLAALKRFGLIVDEGTGTGRRARLSEDALALIRDERPDSTERAAIIRRLALLPAIHRELWDEYKGDLPPDDAAMRFDLVQNRGFTENGADEFIKEFRATIAFAGLAPSDTLTEEALDIDEGAIRPPRIPDGAGKVTDSTTQTVPLPVAGVATWPMIVVPRRMSEAAWEQMLAVLKAMKPGIVNNDDADGVD